MRGVSLDGSLRPHPCHLVGLAEEVRCGTHDVFEDRAANAGRRLSIQVAVLPALRRLVDPDPLLHLRGMTGAAPAASSERFAWGWLIFMTVGALVFMWWMDRRIRRDSGTFEALKRERMVSTGDQEIRSK